MVEFLKENLLNMTSKEEIKKILVNHACDMCECHCDDGRYPDLGIIDSEVNEVVDLILKVMNHIINDYVR